MEFYGNIPITASVHNCSFLWVIGDIKKSSASESATLDIYQTLQWTIA